MASLVARAAVAAAALPSGRARRLGSGRLALAALPGHGAAVLAGRRVGTGHGGVLALEFKKDPVRGVKAASSDSDPDRLADEEDMDLNSLKDLETMYRDLGEKIERLPDMLGLAPPPAVPLSDEEKANQEKFKEITERCIILHADAMDRFGPEQLRPLYPVIHIVHLTFARVAVAAKGGRANPAMTVLVAETLELVRSMVSHVCKAPLPIKGLKKVRSYVPQGPVYGVESSGTDNFEVAWIALLENIYRTVEDDIDEMISTTTK